MQIREECPIQGNSKQPKIETARLILRPFRLSDAERTAELAGDKRVSALTANIPYPYAPQMATDWISTHQALFESQQGVVYAITVKGDDDIIGAVSFPRFIDGHAVLGYWLTVNEWGKGIATEASHGLIDHYRENHNLVGLRVMHYVMNARSQSVIKKLKVPYIGNEMTNSGREVRVYQKTFN